MTEIINSSIGSYWDFYVQFFSDQWNHMTPAKYGGLLIFIFIAGYVLLKSNVRSL